MVAFPAGSQSEKELEEAFINGELPWTIQPNVARANNEEWNKSFEAKSFANSFNRVKRQAAFRVQDLEEAKGKRKKKRLIAELIGVKKPSLLLFFFCLRRF